MLLLLPSGQCLTWPCCSYSSQDNVSHDHVAVTPVRTMSHMTMLLLFQSGQCLTWPCCCYSSQDNVSHDYVVVTRQNNVSPDHAVVTPVSRVSHDQVVVTPVRALSHMTMLFLLQPGHHISHDHVVAPVSTLCLT